jgi:hypothetical protein
MWQKETKSGGTIFSISLNAENLPEPDEKGYIRLTALVNNYKETEQHPDFNLMEPRPQTGGGNGGGRGNGFKGRPAQRPTGNSKFQKRAPVQQEVSEDETDGDESGEEGDESIPF